MELLIDGYNLLHATDLFGTGAAAGTLHGSRESLLRFLAATLSASQRRRTTIVFDAAGAPPGLPRTVHHDHLTVRYAREYADADALLEEIIDRHRAPRGMTVVSSDHRVQRAARRRGAKWLDSETWYRGAIEKARDSQRGKPTCDRPQPGGSVDDWVQEFSTPEIEALEGQLRENGKRVATGDVKSRPTRSVADSATENPFPPGYADDILGGES